MNRVVLAFFILGLMAGSAPAISGYDGIVLTDLQGNDVKVDSLLAEGPVVLNFWATWCRPCRIEMPQIEKIAADLADRKVHFAAISLDARNRKAQLEQFVVKNEIKLPVYADPKGAVAKRFNVAAIPTTVLLDQKGEIGFRTKGYRPGDEVLLKKKIEALLPPEEEGEALGEAGQSSPEAETSAAENVAAEDEPARVAEQTPKEKTPEDEAPEDRAVPSDTGE